MATRRMTVAEARQRGLLPPKAPRTAPPKPRKHAVLSYWPPGWSTCRWVREGRGARCRGCRMYLPLHALPEWGHGDITQIGAPRPQGAVMDIPQAIWHQSIDETAFRAVIRDRIATFPGRTMAEKLLAAADAWECGAVRLAEIIAGTWKDLLPEDAEMVDYVQVTRYVPRAALAACQVREE